MIVCYVVAIVLVLLYGYLSHRSNVARREDILAAVGDQDWLDKTDREIRGFKYTT